MTPQSRPIKVLPMEGLTSRQRRDMYSKDNGCVAFGNPMEYASKVTKERERARTKWSIKQAQKQATA
jgi:hypothetical protein